MRKIVISSVLAGAALVAQPGQAATQLPACAATDLSSTLTTHTTASTYTAGAPTVFASTSCVGFSAGNLLNSAHNADIVAALNALVPGFYTGAVSAFNFGSFTKIDGLNGNQTIDFTTPLNGLTLIGVHYGAGSERRALSL
jgi:hypothetical protein